MHCRMMRPQVLRAGAVGAGGERPLPPVVELAAEGLLVLQRCADRVRRILSAALSNEEAARGAAAASGAAPAVDGDGGRGGGGGGGGGGGIGGGGGDSGASCSSVGDPAMSTAA